MLHSPYVIKTGLDSGLSSSCDWVEQNSSVQGLSSYHAHNKALLQYRSTHKINMTAQSKRQPDTETGAKNRIQPNPLQTSKTVTQYSSKHLLTTDSKKKKYVFNTKNVLKNLSKSGPAIPNIHSLIWCRSSGSPAEERRWWKRGTRQTSFFVCAWLKQHLNTSLHTQLLISWIHQKGQIGEACQWCENAFQHNNSCLGLSSYLLLTTLANQLNTV